MKEIHFWYGYSDMSKKYTSFKEEKASHIKVAISFKELDKIIDEEDTEIIYTTCMGYMNTNLFKKGYKIFVHNTYKSNIEIKLGTNKWTQKEIRMSHNLFKMWLADSIQSTTAKKKVEE